MRRAVIGAVLAAAAVGVALAPGPAEVDPAVDAGRQPRPISSAVLACPELTITDDSASTLAGLVAPDGTGPEGGASASLRVLGATTDLARISEPGVPVSLLVVDRSQPPILLSAEGSWAPSAVAGIASTELGGAGAGLASAACPAPGPQWWFVGAGSQLGRGSALLVSNPAQEPARFDITLYARSGPVEALAGRGIDLPPQAHVRLRLDALVDKQDLLAVHVRATSGRVGAALRDVAVPRGESPRGVDFIPPAVEPTTDLVIGGIPGGEGARELVLVNPGSRFATVDTGLVTEDGPAELPGLATIVVPAGSVISLPLTGPLAQRPAALVLRSDVPITGGLRATWGTTIRDLAWVSAVPAVQAPNLLAAAPAVPAGRGLVTAVTVAAPAAAVTGTLWVSTTPGESVFSTTGPLAEGRIPPAAAPGRGPRMITAASTAPAPVRVEVPAGSQRTIELPGSSGAALAHAWWWSDASSGPAILTHLTRAEEGPAATGYSWWPTLSAVPGLPVREDVGTLAPVGVVGAGDTSADAGRP